MRICADPECLNTVGEGTLYCEGCARKHPEDWQLGHLLNVKRVRADAVRYGEHVCRGGGHVWAVYRGDELLGVYATAKEARRVHSIWPQRSEEHQRMMTQRRYNPGGRKG